eukprot:scaffold62914_cov28-Tisochrysis_lutea.AAC.1
MSDSDGSAMSMNKEKRGAEELRISGPQPKHHRANGGSNPTPPGHPQPAEVKWRKDGHLQPIPAPPHPSHQSLPTNVTP